MADNVYSAVKALHWPEAVRAAVEGGPVPVVHVNIDLTNVCDHACGFCMYAGGAWDLGGQHREFGVADSLPTERVLALVPELLRARVGAVEITGGGEPTIHAAFPAFVHALADAGIGVGVVSNGQAWKDRTVEALARATWVRVSMSSLDEARHRAIRQPKAKGEAGSAARVLANVQRLCRLPGPADRRVGIGYTITADNHEELPALAEAAAQAGADNLRVTYTWVDDDEAAYGGIDVRIQASVAAMRARAAEVGMEVFGPGIWRGYQTGTKRYDRCAYALFVCNITADGRVWPCCVQRHVPGWSYGSIHEAPLDEILASQIRDRFVRGIDVARCLPCIWDPKNEALEPFVFGGRTVPEGLAQPPHLAFV